MTVSVVIPSRLQRLPDGTYFFERAVASILAGSEQPMEIILALDAGVPSPPLPPGIRCVNSPGRGHQLASNHAARLGIGDHLAFLEDDDEWHPDRLKATLEALTELKVGFVSCSQQEYGPDGAPAEVNDFCTASGWLLPRKTFLDFGGFDEEYRITHDNAFLGKMALRGIHRVHITEQGARLSERPWLREVEKYSRIMHAGTRDCLVKRHRHGGAIMEELQVDWKRKKRIEAEYTALKCLYGCIPW